MAGAGGAGPGQCDGAARGQGPLPLLGLQPAGAARLGADGRGRGGAGLARRGAGQVSNSEAILLCILELSTGIREIAQCNVMVTKNPLSTRHKAPRNFAKFL